jgi:hypothetical protein
VLRFATPVSARPAPWLKPSRVIVGKRRKKSRVGIGKIGQLYALLRERLAGRAAMNVMVFAIDHLHAEYTLARKDVIPRHSHLQDARLIHPSCKHVPAAGSLSLLLNNTITISTDRNQ